jgi:hypothetical protein
MCVNSNQILMLLSIRCCDGDALGAVLKWYACSKFCNIDPRVFQVFFWGRSV